MPSLKQPLKTLSPNGFEWVQIGRDSPAQLPQHHYTDVQARMGLGGWVYLWLRLIFLYLHQLWLFPLLKDKGLSTANLEFINTSFFILSFRADSSDLIPNAWTLICLKLGNGLSQKRILLGEPGIYAIHPKSKKNCGFCFSSRKNLATKVC